MPKNPSSGVSSGSACSTEKTASTPCAGCRPQPQCPTWDHQQEGMVSWVAAQLHQSLFADGMYRCWHCLCSGEFTLHSSPCSCVIHGEQENLLLSSGRKLPRFGFQSPRFSGITGSNPARVKQGLSSSETDGVSRSKLPLILFVGCCVTLKTAS